VEPEELIRQSFLFVALAIGHQVESLRGRWTYDGNEAGLR
jgi:hypothetical protein